MTIGDRVLVSGGCEIEPDWLSGRSGCHATLLKFIPGQNDGTAAVVHFDQPVTAKGITGAYAVLELRYAGATWNTPNETVHIELCDFIPRDVRWQDRRQGKWVESHATVTVVSDMRE
jgi:hypothetical protein